MARQDQLAKPKSQTLISDKFIRGGNLTLPDILALIEGDSRILKLCVHGALLSDATHLIRQLTAHCAQLSKFNSTRPTIEELGKLTRFQKCHIYPEEDVVYEHEEFDLFAKRTAAIFAHLLNSASKDVMSDAIREEFRTNIDDAIRVFTSCGYILVDAIRGKDINPQTKILDAQGEATPAPLAYKLERLKQGHLFQGLELVELGAALIELHLLKNIVPQLQKLEPDVKKLLPETQHTVVELLSAHSATHHYTFLTKLATDRPTVQKILADAGGQDFTFSLKTPGKVNPEVTLTLEYSSDLLGKLSKVLSNPTTKLPVAKRKLKELIQLLEHCALRMGAHRVVYTLFSTQLLPLGQTVATRADLAPSVNNHLNLTLLEGLLTTIYLGLNGAIPFVQAVEQQGAARNATPTSPSEATSKPTTVTTPVKEEAIVQHAVQTDLGSIDVAPRVHTPLPPLRVRSRPQYSKNPHRGDPAQDPRIQRRLERERLTADHSLDTAIKLELNDEGLFSKLFPQGCANTQFSDIKEWKDYCRFVTSVLLNKPIGEIEQKDIHLILSYHPHLVHYHRIPNEFPQKVEALCSAIEALRSELRQFHSFYDPKKTSSQRNHAFALPPESPSNFDPIKNPEIFRSHRSIANYRRHLITPIDHENKILAMNNIDPIAAMYATTYIAETIVSGRRIKNFGEMMDAVFAHVQTQITNVRTPSVETLTECYIEAIKRYHAKKDRPPLPSEPEILIQAQQLAAEELSRIKNRNKDIAPMASAVTAYCSHSYRWEKDVKKIFFNGELESVFDQQNKQIVEALHRIIGYKINIIKAREQRSAMPTAEQQMRRGGARKEKLARDTPLAIMPEITLPPPEERT